jgi:hypothetical protein
MDRHAYVADSEAGMQDDGHARMQSAYPSMLRTTRRLASSYTRHSFVSNVRSVKSRATRQCNPPRFVLVHDAPPGNLPAILPCMRPVHTSFFGSICVHAFDDDDDDDVSFSLASFPAGLLRACRHRHTSTCTTTLCVLRVRTYTSIYVLSDMGW